MTRTLLIGLLLAASAVNLHGQTTTFVDVNVVRLGEGDILPARTVVVADGRVTTVRAADSGSTPAPGVTVDGAGLYLVPGLVVFDAHLPSENWLEWREALLVYLANGVTTLGVSEAEIEVLDRARAEGVDVWLRPVLASATALDPLRGAPDPAGVTGEANALSLPSLEGDPLAALRRHALDLSRSPIRVAEIEAGGTANLLLLAEDPLRDATATSRPVGVMVEGRWMPYEDIRSLARDFGEARRLWHMRRVPRQENPRGPWPTSCIGQTLDDCFGGDPECGLHGVLGMAWWLADCGAPSVRADRSAVLDALDLLASVDPIDAWLVGQRVHFALMDGDVDRAWGAAESCASDTWWCQALRGLVLHERDPGSGDVRFDSAYANAPESTPAWSSPKVPGAGDRGLHCEWSDLSYLIEDAGLRASYRAEACGDNVDFERRFWWLADPLWSEEGNERRGEHIARNVRMRLRDDYLRLVLRNHAQCVSSRIGGDRGAEPDDCAHGHSAVVRFGLPNSWRGVPYEDAAGVVIAANGRLANPDPEGGARALGRSYPDRTYPQLRVGFLYGGYSFVPDAGRFLAPTESAASDWAVTWNEGHERMLTRQTWYNLHDQTAVLRRGAELQVLAAAHFPTLLSSLDEIEGFLAAGRVTDRHVEVVPADVDRVTGVIRAGATLPDDGWLVSIEALGPDVRGRARHGAPAPALVDGYGISDPVLVRPQFDPDQDALLGAMLPSTALPERQRVGLYFELYGVEAGHDVELTLARDGPEGRRCLLGRIGSLLGFGGGSEQSGRLRWTQRIEEVTDGAAHAFVALDLRAFGTGEHHVTLTASTGGRTASASIDIAIRQ